MRSLHERYRTLAAKLGGATFIAIGPLSLWPKGVIDVAGAPGYARHAIAYFTTAMLLALAYPALRSRLALAVLLTVYAGALEVAQIWIPGRTSQLPDFAGSTIGAYIGLIAGVLVARAWAQRYRSATSVNR